MSLIIGVSGFANSGKDEVGKILVRDHGFVKMSVGDVVLDLLKHVDPQLFATTADGSDLDGLPLRFWLDDPEMGYEGVKDKTDFRFMMQRLGEGCRKVLHEDVLMDAVLRNAPPRMTMTSTRYRNEAQAIVDKGGFIWRVERPGVVAINDHITETDMLGWDYDYVIDNDGTLDDLTVKVAEAVRLAETQPSPSESRSMSLSGTSAR